MLKKINVILLCLLFCSCTFMQKSNSESFYYGKDYRISAPINMTGSTDYTHVDLGNSDSFRVAMLLPLSGKLSVMGNNMKNAAMMAIDDVNNGNLVVQFFDTKGTSSGTRVAYENAVNADSQLILGPLLAEEVSAISAEARSKGIPIVSFSTSPQVLQQGVYTIGLLNDEQIKRIVKYAAEQGRHSLAVVLPDNQSGMNMFKSVMAAGRAYNVKVVKVGFYRPETMDFTSLAGSMVKGGAGFDVLLVPEYGNRLKAITSMFSYYDVSSPDVLFVGTSVWANTGLSKETELYGAVYPVMPLGNLNSFTNKYKELFSEQPNGLSVFAYDAVMLASALSADRSNLEKAIVRPDGYAGMSGAFRFFINGQNEHGLDIVKVTSGGERVIEPATTQFYGINSSYTYNMGEPNSGYVEMPQVFGKDSYSLQNFLINVQ